MMEIKKCYYLPSASWRPRKAGGVIRSEYKGLRNGGNNGINPIPKARKDISYPNTAGRQEDRGGFFSSSGFLFYPGPQQMGGCPPTLERAICFRV